MKFNELDSVKVLKDFPEEGIRKGEVGVVVFAFTKPNEAYEVEFDDGNGRPKATFPIFTGVSGKCLGVGRTSFVWFCYIFVVDE